MIVMPSNSTGDLLRELAAMFPSRIQNLMTPGRWWQPSVPYALDNGAFGAWKNGKPFPADLFVDLCNAAAAHNVAPRWVVCPDVVGDWPATVASWREWAPRLRDTYGWPLALAVQDGADEDEALSLNPDLLFVGGSTEWKWRTFRRWCALHPRVHVGRVNRVEWALDCRDAGVESIDGTGWMRVDRHRRKFRRLLELLDAPQNLLVEAA